MNLTKHLKRFFASLSAEARDVDMSARTLRRFGFLVGGIVVALALVSFFRAHAASLLATALLAGGIGLVVFAWGSPASLRGIYRVWMFAALLLGLVVGTLLLFVLFYLVVTPVGALRRFFGDDPLERRFTPEAPTYWKGHPRRGAAHMRRPF
ncbi:hypothetical protein HY091_00340 [Candidatus Kaiserbacteria bacterium]|nr:hypothetical protein [Candidatus Kaiserbacteria bacterium]